MSDRRAQLAVEASDTIRSLKRASRGRRKATRTFDGDADGNSDAAHPIDETGEGRAAQGVVQLRYGETLTVTSPGATDDDVVWTELLEFPRPAGFRSVVLPTAAMINSVEAYYEWTVQGTADGAATLKLWLTDPEDGGPILLNEVPVASGPFCVSSIDTGLIRALSETWVEVDGTLTDARATYKLVEIPADLVPRVEGADVFVAFTVGVARVSGADGSVMWSEGWPNGYQSVAYRDGAFYAGRDSDGVVEQRNPDTGALIESIDISLGSNEDVLSLAVGADGFVYAGIQGAAGSDVSRLVKIEPDLSAVVWTRTFADVFVWQLAATAGGHLYGVLGAVEPSSGVARFDPSDGSNIWPEAPQTRVFIDHDGAGLEVESVAVDGSNLYAGSRSFYPAVARFAPNGDETILWDDDQISGGVGGLAFAVNLFAGVGPQFSGDVGLLRFDGSGTITASEANVLSKESRIRMVATPDAVFVVLLRQFTDPTDPTLWRFDHDLNEVWQVDLEDAKDEFGDEVFDIAAAV